MNAYGEGYDDFISFAIKGKDPRFGTFLLCKALSILLSLSFFSPRLDTHTSRLFLFFLTVLVSLRLQIWNESAQQSDSVRGVALRRRLTRNWHRSPRPP